MVAARYWKFSGLDSLGTQALALTELELWSEGSRVDAPGMVTASVSPASGSVSSLSDGSMTSEVQWTVQSVALTYDLGSAVSVDQIRIGKPASLWNHLFGLTLESSSSPSGPWELVCQYQGIPYPTGSQAVIPLSKDPSAHATVFLYNFDVAVGTTSVPNQSQRTAPLTLGGATISSTATRFGKNTLRVASSQSATATADALGLGFGVGDFCINAEIMLENPTGPATWFSMNEASPLRVVISSGKIAVQGGGGGATTLETAVLTWVSTQFYQVTIERYNGVTTIYRDGVALASGADTRDVSFASGILYVGQNGAPGAGSWPMQGYIANFWAKPLAVYKGAFSRDTEGLDPIPSVLLRAQDFRRGTLGAAIKLNPSPNHVMTPSSPLVMDRAISVRAWSTGGGKLVSTVKEKDSPVNMPLRRLVHLMDMVTSEVIDSTWSDATTGAYGFYGLDLSRKYTVFAYDPTHTYRAVMADNLTPEKL